MEGKRASAAALYCYCMLIMLSMSGQKHQVARFAGLCGCLATATREGHRHPGWFCTLKCVETCVAVVSDEVHGATLGTAAGCSEICFTTSICGVAQTTDGTADADATTAACVDDCTEKWNPHKNKHT